MAPEVDRHEATGVDDVADAAACPLSGLEQHAPGLAAARD